MVEGRTGETSQQQALGFSEQCWILANTFGILLSDGASTDENWHFSTKNYKMLQSLFDLSVTVLNHQETVDPNFD